MIYIGFGPFISVNINSNAVSFGAVAQSIGSCSDLIYYGE
jgi:hypothetical protein